MKTHACLPLPSSTLGIASLNDGYGGFFESPAGHPILRMNKSCPHGFYDYVFSLVLQHARYFSTLFCTEDTANVQPGAAKG